MQAGTDILFERRGAWGVVTFNRPDALNALTEAMCIAMRHQLAEWAADASVGAVLAQGAGEKAYCAGGDIRWLYDTAQFDPARAAQFFAEEYRNNAAIKHFPKPYVALIDGILMGGGVGVSVHGSHRVAGDRTLFAMPETGIGLFPDVGGGYFLPRLGAGLGQYLGLVGTRLNAADCMDAGIATHIIPTDQMPALKDALFALPLAEGFAAAVDSVLAQMHQSAAGSAIATHRAQIEAIFGADSLADVCARLETDGSDWAAQTRKLLARMSPTSLALTFEQLRRGAALSFDEVMRMEFRLASRVMAGREFIEGVRAQIIDKDRNPQWQPATLEAIDPAEIERYFAPLGPSELTLP